MTPHLIFQPCPHNQTTLNISSSLSLSLSLPSPLSSNLLLKNFSDQNQIKNLKKSQTKKKKRRRRRRRRDWKKEIDFYISSSSSASTSISQMDSDLWASRLAAAKRQYTLQHNQNNSQLGLDRLSLDDFEVEEEIRPDFPCPYCYEDYDIASLCSHLEDEHPFESRVTVCPICSVKVTKDMLSHITLQHGQLFKLQRRRRLRRVAIPNSQALSLLGRDLREAHLQVLLGGSGYRSSNASASTAATDSFLSSLVMNFNASEADEVTKSTISSAEDASPKIVTPTPAWKSSFDSSLSYEERQQKIKQATVRAGFVQDLIISTLFSD